MVESESVRGYSDGGLRDVWFIYLWFVIWFNLSAVLFFLDVYIFIVVLDKIDYFMGVIGLGLVYFILMIFWMKIL